MNHAVFWVTLSACAVSQTARAVLAVGNRPGGHEPLVQAERRILVDRPGLQGKLAPGVLVPALPAVLVRQEDYVIAPAGGTGHAIGPAACHDVLPATVGVGEAYDRFGSPTFLCGRETRSNPAAKVAGL